MESDYKKFNENILYFENEDFDNRGFLVDQFETPVVMMIHSNSCPHCETLRPEFQKFANSTNLICSNILIDGSENEASLGNRINKYVPDLVGVPVIIIYIDGMYARTYDGPGQAEAILDWAERF